MSQQTYDANDVLMGGGAENPAWKFADPNPGQPKVGTITNPPTARQERDYDPQNPGGGNPKVFPSGDPIMGVIVTVQTAERDPSIEGDAGKRTFYIEGRYLKEAVRHAVQTAGRRGLEVGGQLEVEFTHREDPMDKRSRKYWQIRYTPAADTALIGEGQQAPVAPAQPVTGTQPLAPQAPALAPAAPAADTSEQVIKAQQLVAVGMDDATIAAATGLDVSVVAALRTAA